MRRSGLLVGTVMVGAAIQLVWWASTPPPRPQPPAEEIAPTGSDVETVILVTPTGFQEVKKRRHH